MLCPVVASSIFKWRCYNTFIRCCVTCPFTTLQAISYVIMHFTCFIVACFVLDIYGYFGVLLTWRLLFTTLVCPTHSSHYRTNVLFTMSRIIFCHYVACSWFALDILWLPFFTWSLVGAGLAQLSYAIVESLGYLELFSFSIVNLFLSPTLLHPLGSSSALGLGTFSHGLILAPT